MTDFVESRARQVLGFLCATVFLGWQMHVGKLDPKDGLGLGIGALALALLSPSRRQVKKDP